MLTETGLAVLSGTNNFYIRTELQTLGFYMQLFKDTCKVIYSVINSPLITGAPQVQNKRFRPIK
jgi:hypothetical protein